MKVIGIVGSPRRGGNTDTLVSEALRGAVSVGARVEKVLLGDLDVRPCLGCGGCHGAGVCVQEDDTADLLDKLFTGDGWILGTPVYWWGPTAQMKAFVDRWYAPWHSDVLARRMRKKVALITAFGDADPATPRHVVGMFAASLEFIKADFVAQLHVTADQRGAVAGDEAAMRRAYELGVEVTRSAR